MPGRYPALLSSPRINEIVFVNGVRLPVRVVNESAQGVWGFSDRTDAATLLEVNPPGANPVLADGTRICGSKPVTYLALWLESPSGLYVSTYTGSAPPKGIEDAHVCTIYFFVAET